VLIMNRSTQVLRLLFPIIAFLTIASSLFGQQLTITSPAPGTVYSSGQTINVAVSVTNGQVFAVQVGVEDLAFSPYQSQSPYLFSLTVPSGIIGPKSLFAVALIGDETVLLSPGISVDIEPSSQPSGISFQQGLVTFGYEGQQRTVGVSAVFADGSTLDISRSSQLKFSSDSPGVVSVDPSGLMTANGSGNANVTVSYGNLSSTIKAIGSTGVKGDMNGDGVVNSDDLFLLEAMLGATPTGPNDVRDMNGDGKIDDLDVQVLLTFCGSACPSMGSTTTSLVISSNQIQVAKPATLTATVTGGGSTPPTGNVSFVVDGQLQDVGPLAAFNQASVSLTSLPVGMHTAVAIYSGDSKNSPSTSQSVSIQVVAVNGSDVTAPTTSFALSAQPNAAGWNNSNVTIRLNSTDNEPGGTGVKQIQWSLAGAQTGSSTVPANTTAVMISTEGTTTLTYFGTDNAGNVETAHTLTIRLDKNPPIITGTRTPAANANGWNTSAVAVSFQCADSLSGLAAGSPPAPTILSAEGAGQSVSGTCTDVAGNSATSTVSGINIDKIPPVVTASANPAMLWPPNGNMVAVTISGTMADGLSGVNRSSASFAVNDSYGLVQPNGPVSVTANGRYSFTVSLEARRNGQDTNGRFYTITVNAQDNAGNAGSATTIVVVPHDQGD
jgi:hypothetical protein